MGDDFFPELNLVLFNTDGDDSVTASERRGCMVTILDSILSNNYRNLFVLAQNDISVSKHEKLCQKLNQNPDNVPRNENAGVYYNNHPNANYRVEYQRSNTLQHAEAALDPDLDNSFDLSRLTACVLTSTMPGDTPPHKILLISWHGPNNVDIHRRNEILTACLQRLVRFSEELHQQLSAADGQANPGDRWVIILGGSFNFPAEKARQELGEEWEVLDGYTQTADRLDREDKTVYVTCWPRRRMVGGDACTLCPAFKRTYGERPFRHNIVLYRFNEPVGFGQNDANVSE